MLFNLAGKEVEIEEKNLFNAVNVIIGNLKSDISFVVSKSDEFDFRVWAIEVEYGFKYPYSNEQISHIVRDKENKIANLTKRKYDHNVLSLAYYLQNEAYYEAPKKKFYKMSIHDK